MTLASLFARRVPPRARASALIALAVAAIACVAPAVSAAKSRTAKVRLTAIPSLTAKQRSLTMAIRLNENLIVGNIQGQRVLTIKHGGQTSTMQFTLFVVEQEAKP